MRFVDLKLSEPVLRAVHQEGYEIPTPIQQKAIAHILAGKDLVGCAQTGTGKTAAFALPILSRFGRATATDGGHKSEHSRDDVPSAIPSRHLDSLERSPSPSRPATVLVLTPTRELAVQIAESFSTYGRYTGLRTGLIFGGVSQSGQERMLRMGVDILVATPGRLLDLMNQRLVDLTHIEIFVLDEADRMLDMGFIADIRKVIARLPSQRQTLLFSATMPPEIKRLADGILRHPVHVAVSPVSSTAERVTQSVYHVERRTKPALLLHLLETDHKIRRVLIFTRTKHGADRLAKGLSKHDVRAEAIHGNKSQNQRQRALDTFKQGESRVLVATDIAARGLDIELVSHVINYELPNIPESYVHRIGRTGRAGESGVAISFCDSEERELLRDIERVIENRVPVATYPPGIARAESSHGEQRDSDRRAFGERDASRSAGSSRSDRRISHPSPRPAQTSNTRHRAAQGNASQAPHQRVSPWRSEPRRSSPNPPRPPLNRSFSQPGSRTTARPEAGSGRRGVVGAPSTAPGRVFTPHPVRSPARPGTRDPAPSQGRWTSGEFRRDGTNAAHRQGPAQHRNSHSSAGERERNPSAEAPRRRDNPDSRLQFDERRSQSRAGNRSEPLRHLHSGHPNPRHR